VELLTVEQMLMYQSELKRPQREPTAAKQRNVEELLTNLGLKHVRGSVIGGPLDRGISGGQVREAPPRAPIALRTFALGRSSPTEARARGQSRWPGLLFLP